MKSKRGFKQGPVTFLMCLSAAIGTLIAVGCAGPNTPGPSVTTQVPAHLGSALLAVRILWTDNFKDTEAVRVKGLVVAGKREQQVDIALDSDKWGCLPFQYESETDKAYLHISSIDLKGDIYCPMDYRVEFRIPPTSLPLAFVQVEIMVANKEGQFYSRKTVESPSEDAARYCVQHYPAEQRSFRLEKLLKAASTNRATTQSPSPTTSRSQEAPVVEHSGWLEVGQTWSTSYDRKSSKIKGSTDAEQYYKLTTDSGSKYLLQFSKDTVFQLPSEDRSDSGVTFRLGQEFRYKVRGHASETSQEARDNPFLAPSVIRVISIQRTK